MKNILKYLAVALAGVLVIGGVWIGTSRYEKITPTETSTAETETKESSETQSETSGTTQTTSQTEETEPPEVTLSDEDIMNVDRLIDRYYTAKINDDAEELNKIVDSDVPYDVESLQTENQFIEKYDNFRTYSLPGLTDSYIIVYVRYDIYFNGISVGAPSLNHFIVARGDSSNFYIYDRAVSDEFQAYVEETERSEMVLNLRKEVEDDLAAVCEKNADLNYLMQLLNGGSADSPASEGTEETNQEEQEDTEETGEEVQEDSGDASS